ncbi:MULTISPECIES: winged helix-turn-helix domain-containing protein [Pseudomonas]|uniref:Winged helix-turn-helix domain-containing protein n=1 Tax=Pseudomonas wuhanensis TaxID=2954098 RepID=A0ABY9GLF7_9PSED|nr:MULTISPECIES: winged helix-turn-helix domain-containing protein [unclassified Pseudomonas]WLI10777.1 winged helix-turn-helix domain-containing protein [Pseudomonas sp. FP603]WLI16599.1 winged helix-turn-helix domain-containing protein [Pseudomonas sp. FP607]
MNVSSHDCSLEVTALKAGAAAHSLFFGEFELCPNRLLLLKGGRSVSLNHRALHLLVALARRPFELIEKDELTACAWPARVMEESSLRTQIAALRRALGASVDCPYVETVAGRGYRFVATVSGQRQAMLPWPDLPLSIGLPRIEAALIDRSEQPKLVGRRVLHGRFITITG